MIDPELNLVCDLVRLDHDTADAPIEKRNPPYLKDGKQLTLREALAELAARGDVGAGGLVELDADAKVK